MHVLMTADTVGGVWTYALELADALAPRGVRVTLATMGAALDDDQRAQLEATAVAGVHESTYALEWMPEPWEDVAHAGEWLLALADELRPDLVHLNGYAHAALAWRAPTLVVAHSDVCSWWRAVRGGEPGPEWDEYRRSVEEGLGAADLIVAPTRAALADLEASYTFESERAVVHNGRRPLPRLPKDDYVAAAGRFWDDAKNLGALRRVAPRLPWPLRVAGADEPWPRADVDELLARAAVFVAPACYEPFGLAALEAASTGCALVLGDLPSLREVWGDAALYVHPDDEEALLTVLERLIDDSPAREGLGRRALERSALYTPGRMAGEYVAQYRRLAAKVAA